MGEDDDSISATKDISNEESDDDKSDENTEDVDSSIMDSEVLDEIQHEEQLAAVGQGGCEDEGEDAELHVYEVRQDVNGERVSLRTGTRSEMSVLRDRSYRACMVLFRYYLQNRDLNFVELRIQSPHLKRRSRKSSGRILALHFTPPGKSPSGSPQCVCFITGGSWWRTPASPTFPL